MIIKFKLFEIKTDRPIHVGDEVIWHNKAHTSASSNQANNGDLCIITQLKTIKGEIYAKAKNKETGKPICKIFDRGCRYMPYSEDGHWFEFDRYFKHEEDSWAKELKRKYNI